MQWTRVQSLKKKINKGTFIQWPTIYYQSTEKEKVDLYELTWKNVQDVVLNAKR